MPTATCEKCGQKLPEPAQPMPLHERPLFKLVAQALKEDPMVTIYKMRREGEGLRAVAALLTRITGLKVSHTTVADWLREDSRETDERITAP